MAEVGRRDVTFSSRTTMWVGVDLKPILAASIGIAIYRGIVSPCSPGISPGAMARGFRSLAGTGAVFTFPT